MGCFSTWNAEVLFPVAEQIVQESSDASDSRVFLSILHRFNSSFQFLIAQSNRNATLFWFKGLSWIRFLSLQRKTYRE